jgi:hypothetical protein
MRLILGLMSGAVVALVALAAGCSCGGNDPATPQDAATDSGPKFDRMLHDAASAQDDAGPTCGTFKAPDGCGFEMWQCTVAKTNSDECGNDLDCVDTNLYGLVCLRKCNCSAECGVNTICLPSKADDYAKATDATRFVNNAKGHCFWSFCGDEGTAQPRVGNGVFFGACALGGDAFIKAGKVGTRPGTCIPEISAGPSALPVFGLCQEAGEKPRGGTCSFSLNQCADPASFERCAAGTVCIGHQGDQTGTCAKLCDPSVPGFSPTIPDACGADSDVPYDQYCQDSSSYFPQWSYATDGVTPVCSTSVFFYTYVGYCVDAHGCDALAAASNCGGVISDGGVPLNGCEPTNSVTSYGQCSVTGNVPLGGTCNGTLLCQPNLVCITSGGSVQGMCERYCGLGPNAAKWPCDSGQYCDAILYGSDATPGKTCYDDPWSQGYGICRPDTRQDGGLAQDGGREQDGGQEQDGG